MNIKLDRNKAFRLLVAACIGYCIIAMENAGFSKEQIKEVVNKLYEILDQRSISEAARKCMEFQW